MLLITGTGMPSLRLIAELSVERSAPVLSSNLCLARECLRSAGISFNERSLSEKYPLLDGWQVGLDNL